jgi:serine/alanine adding enzyme
MHRHHRRLVRRAQVAGHEVAIERAPRSLDEFVPLYEQTMRRADAAPFYFFPPAYWAALARDVPLVRVDVRAHGELRASVLGLGEPPWLHYHLGAASDAARGTGASHLALHELARWGRAHGFTTLHLGGGVGGRADSLLAYKLRFAPGGLIGAAIGKAVHDEAAYLRLTGKPAVDWDGFFPAYRVSRRA